MHTLMIVDDDEWIREGMARNVPWESRNIRVVGTAADGNEAWELVQRLQPDLLLSDIRMPFLDGLQLAALIKAHSLDVKVVFLTGYDDFSYAKQALQLQASDYILKFEDNDKILESVANAGRSLDEQRRSRQKEKRGHALIVNQFYSDLIASVRSESTVEHEAGLLGLSFCGPVFCVAVIGTDGVERFLKPNKPADLELLLFSIKNLCAELLNDTVVEGFQVQAVQYNHRINLLFNFPSEMAPEERQRAVEKVSRIVIEAVKSYLKIETIRIGVGSFGERSDHIPLSYEEALIAVSMKDVLDERAVIFCDQVKHSRSSHQAMLTRITDYIAANYHKGSLSLAEAAGLVHITPTYVSTLFKKYKDVNFSDYVLRIRMEKAIGLLVNTDLKVYEIAEKVGYSNTQYFSVQFKKFTGFTVMEYRQSRR